MKFFYLECSVLKLALLARVILDLLHQLFNPTHGNPEEERDAKPERREGNWMSRKKGEGSYLPWPFLPPNLVHDKVPFKSIKYCQTGKEGRESVVAVINLTQDNKILTRYLMQIRKCFIYMNTRWSSCHAFDVEWLWWLFKLLLHLSVS